MRHPYVLVVYNRPEHIRRVIESLSKFCPEPLYVFCDGPKSNQDERDVLAVRDIIARYITWTKPGVIERGDNFGLARSIVAAVDYVLERHDTIILLEDDCVVGPHFSYFMETCLDKYWDNSRILGITGYTIPLPDVVHESYPYDCYTFPRIGSWGWATWRDRWEFYQRDFVTAYETAKYLGCDLTAGGKDIPSMIERSIAGKLDIWSPGWVLANVLTDTYYIYPTASHIANIGYDGSGTHCGKSSRYDTPIAKVKPIRFPIEVPEMDRRIVENFRKYY